MNPLLPVVMSSIDVSSACWPPPRAGIADVDLNRSPGFISRVFALGVNDARFASCGLGGPVGTPFVWMNAKFVGSMQLLLQFSNPTVHSRSLM